MAGAHSKPTARERLVTLSMKKSKYLNVKRIPKAIAAPASRMRRAWRRWPSIAIPQTKPVAAQSRTSPTKRASPQQ